VDVEVLRRLRRRSLAALRKEVEPAPQHALARFVAAWQGVGPDSPRRADSAALYRIVDQLQGAPVPASSLEAQILANRLPGYTPSMLDELCASGEIVWAGAGAVGSNDGWVALATADDAPLLLPEPLPVDLTAGAAAIRDELAGRGALFFRQIADAAGPGSIDTETLLALWELVWAGLVTNDTLAPLRALTGGMKPSAGRRHGHGYGYGQGLPRGSGLPRRGPAFPTRLGPPTAAGRWSLLPEREPEPTRRLHAAAEQLLQRHGIVTRGAVMAERVPGGFAGVYPVFKALEESGRCRRGYFVEGLGGAQFALPGAVDRMRALTDQHLERPRTHVLAAADPAQPYGAALPWPDRDAERAGHRPGRKAGAVAVLVDGSLVIYVERGGRTLLTYSEDPDVLQPAVDALALAVRDGLLGKLTVEKADGAEIFDTPLALALTSAGFRASSRGLRLRA
jgi:ATP-dependent Lhr-like helicase